MEIRKGRILRGVLFGEVLNESYAGVVSWRTLFGDHVFRGNVHCSDAVTFTVQCCSEGYSAVLQ